MYHELDNRPGLARCLEGLAGLDAAEARLPRRAIVLAGAARAVRDVCQFPLRPIEETLLEASLQPAKSSLGEAATWAALQDGQALSISDAIALALAQQPNAGRKAHVRLTPRERQVAGLVARGFTNRQIAAELIFTEATAAKHVEHVLDKLGFKSRIEIATWMAVERLDDEIRM